LIASGVRQQLSEIMPSELVDDALLLRSVVAAEIDGFTQC